MEHIIKDTFLLNLPIEVLLTFIITIFLIFLGINEKVNAKPYQKKNLLLMYLILFITTFYFENFWAGVLLFCLIWIISGIALLQSEDISLERELDSIKLFKYITTYWIYLVKSYILIVCAAFIILFNWLMNEVEIYPVENLLKYCIALTIPSFFLYHYLKNTQDYFGIRNWETVKNEIENKVLSIETDLQLLSFLYFMEDKYLFKRKSTVYGSFDIYMGLKNNLFGFLRNSNTMSLQLNDSRFSKYNRGYSTIEQQVTRSTFLIEKSYRYKVRRKLFVERSLNKAFVNAWCIEKSKEYKKNDRKNAKEKLKLSLKYHYLRYYLIEILGNPSDIDELIKRMSNESRVSMNLYRKVYARYMELV